MILHMFADTYTFEGVIIKRVRDFLTAFGYQATVTRDLPSDNTPPLFAWIRIIGPAIEVSTGLQYQTIQVSVSAADTSSKSGRAISSEVANLIRAFIETDEFVGEPIINGIAASGSYATDELEGSARPAYTFTAAVYQTSARITTNSNENG